jgi:hypothetical protein
MKVLKILNKINFLAIGIYIPYLWVSYEEFFFGKEKEGGIYLLAVVLFIVSMFCGGITLIVAKRKNVDSSVTLDDLKEYDRKPLIFAFVVYLTGIVLFLIFVHSELMWFYIIPSTMCFVSAIVCKAAIIRIEESPFYTVSISTAFLPVPFVLFFSGFIFLADRYFDTRYWNVIGIAWFLICGSMLLAYAWCSQFVVDKNDNTIQKDNILTFLKTDSIISLDEVEYVIEKKTCLIIKEGKTEYKIPKFYSNIVKLKNTLAKNGIETVSSDLIK